jgi:MoxR-like ATPase
MLALRYNKIRLPMPFTSTARYIATRDLEVAVNASVTLGRPLLVKGEPGTGKTVLAEEVAAALGLPRERDAGGAADRRDRQGRYRIPQ